jgi:hypothetical protein
MYEALKHRQWKPLRTRGSNQGETWFLGDKAFLINFFTEDYVPQGDFSDLSSTAVHSGSITWDAKNEDEYAAITVGLVEEAAISILGLPYKGFFSD